jgi:2,4-dienoyl-CoA reductase-like NADH-dependent reductase (Old Yellow Enzyme family)
VGFARRIREEAGVLTAAVGLITTAEQAEEIVASGKADLILMAREFLRDPYFPLNAARSLGASIVPPVQYGRALHQQERRTDRVPPEIRKPAN